MIDRRSFLLSAAALAACSRAVPNIPPDAKIMAITMDDFAQSFDVGLSLEDRNAKILNAFDTVGHKAAGFVTGSFVKSDTGQKVVESWIARGHEISNHTWTHAHANETSTEVFLADIARNKDYLSGVPGTNAYFRFPFLDDGKDRAQQVALFEGLERMGLINAPVTIGTIDWYTTSRLEAKLRDDPNADLAPYRDYYVEMCVTLANYWENIAKIQGHVSLPHLTLVHHNILNGLFLKDVLLALKADGWYFMDAKDALSTTLYHDLPPDITNGRNWLTLRGNKRGMDHPDFPKKYWNNGRKTMDALGL
jgi:peptidoglycan/xylan/chitin deacetylase (PgdA/CDA1 family)